MKPSIYDALEALAILIGFCGLLFLSDSLDRLQPPGWEGEPAQNERIISWDQQQVATLTNE